MAQWDVYANPSVRTRGDVPFLVDVQSDLLDGLGSRLMVPLVRTRLAPAGLPPRLCPVFTVAEEEVVLMPQEAGSMSARLLKHSVGSLRAFSHDIVGAIDAVVGGL